MCFNLEVARTAARDRRLKQFVVEMALGWAGQKHGVALDPKFRLPKIQYKGAQVQPQRMRVDKKPLVTEIREVPEEPDFPLLTKPRRGAPQGPAAPPPPSAPRAPAAGGAAPAEGRAGAPAEPSGRPAEAAPAPASHRVDFEGRPVEAAVVTLPVPARLVGAAGAAGLAASLEVHVSGETLAVSAAGAGLLTTQLPFAGDGPRATASLRDAPGDPGARPGLELVVRVPVLGVRDWMDQMRRDAPHRMGSLQLASTFDDEP